jgi:hypothetical protein
MKININKILALSAALALSSNAHAGSLGVTFGFNDHELGGYYTDDIATHPIYNIPLFNIPANVYPYTATWDERAEELASSGIDFVAPVIRGNYPNANWGNPAELSRLITGLSNVGATCKIAIFDDNASTWGGQYTSVPGNSGKLFDVSDQNNWKYVWDQNYKIFYQTVPDAWRYKINGRPLIILWTGNVGMVNMNGNLSKLLTYVRQQCQSTFGFNPYIVVPPDWLQNDPSSNNSGIVDGVQGWFGMSTPYTVSTFNGTKIGACAPAFNFVGNGNNMVIDPNHGQTFDNDLANTVNQCVLTLCEGFTDYAENCAMDRVRNLDGSGNPLSYSQTGYDYPNQRLNKLRKYSANPFPSTLKEEVENCDTFGGASGGTGFYRNGSIKIENTSDAGGGYDVGNIQNNEWFEWQEVPVEGNVSFNVRVATTAANCKVHFVIDGSTKPSVTLPNTGGWQAWTTVNAGTFSFPSGSLHTVRLVCETGSMNVNWWQLAPVLNGSVYHLVCQGSRMALDNGGSTVAGAAVTQYYQADNNANQEWKLVDVGGGWFNLVCQKSGMALDNGGSTTDGATVTQYSVGSGNINQYWKLVPMNGGYYHVICEKSNKALDNTGSTTPGSIVWQWADGGVGNANQNWSLRFVR